MLSQEKLNEHSKLLREQEREVFRKNRDLIEELQRIPHLDLGIDIDIGLLVTEIAKIKKWTPHKLHPNKNFKESYYRHHEFSFTGQCIFDFQDDPDIGMSDTPGHLHEEKNAGFDDNFRLKFKPTYLGQQMPDVIKILEKISPYVNRTRIIKTPPGGGIPWHSHHNNVYQTDFYRLCTVNIPIISNSSCTHSVRNFENTESGAHELHYQPGRAFLFNSWHDHQFWNNGEGDRICLIPYFNFSDEDLLSFLKPLVENYQGPRIG